MRRLLIASTLLASFAWAQKTGCVIQPQSVGVVHAGMTAAQARLALHDATLKPSEDAGRLPMFVVIRGGLHTMDLYVDAGEPLSQRSKIELIRVYDEECATRDGVRPGMQLAAVPAKYGRLKRLRVTDTESREYAEFENLPGWLEIQVGNGQVGVYAPGKRCTTTYASGAHIASLWISHPGARKLPEDASTCNVPRRR
jgi:hypothetical protein